MNRRVRLKSWLRSTFAMLSSVTGVAALWRFFFARHGVRILAYHGVEPIQSSPLSVSVDNFEAQIAYLARHNDIIDFDTFAKWRRGEYTSSKPMVVLTFDDGFRNNLTFAAPILRKYEAPATFFVIGSKFDGADERYMSVPEMSDLVTSGLFRIGSHSMNHLSMAQIPDDAKAREIGGSKPLIEDALGIEVDLFCYPYGTFNDFDQASVDVLKTHGYAVACTSINGINFKGTDPLRLRRTKVEWSDDAKDFRRLLNGGLDGWFFVDYFLRFLQRPDAVEVAADSGVKSDAPAGG